MCKGSIDCFQESVDPRLRNSRVKLTRELGTLGRGQEVSDGLEDMAVSHWLPGSQREVLR